MNQKELLDRFGDYLRYEKRYSVHTVESYSRDSKQFWDYLNNQFHIYTFPEVTHHHVRSWVVSLLKEKNQAASVRRKLSSVVHLFKWMRRTGHINHHPALKIQLPKIPERLPKTLPATALNKLWKIMGDQDGEEKYSSIRDAAMIGLLYGCGLRRSELINLTWGNYDESRQLLLILGKGRKHRQVPVAQELSIMLKKLKKVAVSAWEQSPDMRIILMDNGKPCYPKFVHNKVVGLLSIVTTAEKKSPHTLRHSMATHMMDRGAELNAIKTILGHASLAATQVYTHNSISRLKEIYSQSHPTAKRNA